MANKQGSLGDRFAEITVVLVTIAALAAGWFYKSSVENASIPFSAEGISAEAPKGWLQSEPSGDVLLRTTDINSTGFGATYTIRKVVVTSEATAAEVAGLVSLEHARDLLAFRMLDQREVTVYGRNAFEINYVFVESNPDLTHTEIPSVVRGTDYVFLNGDHAIVVSFQADEKNYDLDLDRFHLFLQSLNF
ncbi:MAG: hypothetical protein DPW18_00665 [Chloroflexi bacterium]|nr:hypothetical protein [Chloroflexota bacterium]MDL1941320.1 hypothetical protein [Chloroflexi bacterium CFX2]